MARDVQRVWLDIETVRCHDEGDGWGSAEPYLWTVFFTIDGSSVALTESLTLSGTATVVTTPGSHGNLGDTDVDAGDVVPVPAAIGELDTLLTPIPVPASLQPLVGDDLPGVVGVVCVLMEEDNVSDAGAEAGHTALDGAVTAALNDIIATRSFSNPDIGEAEIAQYLDGVSTAVANAVQDQQNFFENLWSWLNADDVIGSRVFFWTQDDLASGATVPFSQRWTDHGDWELSGHVNAATVCPATSAGNADRSIAEAVSDAADDMRAFRDREFGGTRLPAWWALAERNTPQLAHLLRDDRELVASAAALFRALPALLADRDAEVPAEQLDHAGRILQRLRQVGSRRSRVDASRALDVLAHLRGRTVAEAVTLLANVHPGRSPEPAADVRDLLNPRLGAPGSVLEPRE